MPKLVVATLLVVSGVLLGISMVALSPEPAGARPIEWLDTPRSLESFSLSSVHGQFDQQSLADRWTVVLIGFLHCPDICPTSMSQLATLVDALDAEPIGQQVQYLFVSVDPGRDSVLQLDQYTRAFRPEILGVTGTEEQLVRFTRGLGVRAEVAADAQDYEVSHSIMFSIIDANGRLSGRFGPGFDAVDLVSSFEARIAGAGG